MSKKTITVAALALAGTLALSGCADGWTLNDTSHDLEGVTFVDPDDATGFNNVDGHPNIVRLCIDGVAFATTTREYSVLRVEAWDEYCATKVG